MCPVLKSATGAMPSGLVADGLLFCFNGSGTETHLKSRCYSSSKVQLQLIIFMVIDRSEAH